MIRLFFSLIVGFSCSIGLQHAAALSLSASLGGFQKKLALGLSGITASSFSGVALYPAAATLVVIDDAGGEVYELSIKGDLLRTIALSGFNDTEGITHQSGNFFFIVEERLANVVRITLPSRGSGPVKRDDSFVFSLSENWGNSGLEGVAYDSVSHLLYAVKEEKPAALFRITLDGEGNPAAFFENQPFSLADLKGDAAGIYILSDGTFLIVNQMENKLTGYSQTGVKLSELPLGMNKPEGVTVDENSGTLYVVGEPREFCVFENPGLTAQTIQPAVSPTGLSCIQVNSGGKSVAFNYELSAPARVTLAFFSPHGKGRKILLKESTGAGRHRLEWQHQPLQTGVYMYRFLAGKTVSCGSLVIR